MRKLNPDKVPKALVPLLPMAEKWGIGDDYERENAIKHASREKLDELIHCLDGIGDEDLFGWLGGAESLNKKPTDEYLAFTCLTMAFHSAKLELQRNIGH